MSGEDRARRHEDRAAWTCPRRLLIGLVGTAAVATLAWVVAVGYLGSEWLMHGDDEKHGCLTPADYGWAYEAVNYDIALDTQLPPLAQRETDCRRAGASTALDGVVSRDGVRLAGWYIPAGDGRPATAPTVVIVHGWGASKSDALRYAGPIHAGWNLLLIDTRYRGRSGGDWMSFGVREADDLQAMLDWLERTKHPSSVAVLGDSAGAGAAMKLARADQRIRALVLESSHARSRTAFAARGSTNALSFPIGLTVPIGMAAVWLRTGGVWLDDADPLAGIADLGDRPLAISYGTADTSDLPKESALVLYSAALAAGVPVELHACEGADHGKTIDHCPADYGAWLQAFLERAIGGGSAAAIAAPEGPVR